MKKLRHTKSWFEGVNCIQMQASSPRICSICKSQIPAKNIYYIDLRELDNNVKTRICVKCANRNFGLVFKDPNINRLYGITAEEK